ncbi:MAG TPA: hypothetical protein VER04_24405 [Polyangiaceae bacterium]|nr:hypothetical protein [Polyangiaceae bacterium]
MSDRIVRLRSFYGDDVELRWTCPFPGCTRVEAALERYLDKGGKRHWLAALHQHVAEHFTLEQLEKLAKGDK